MPYNMEKDLSYNLMTTKTKDFIQKICYKRTASVDMTRFGFINDTKLYPANILLKPLREQLKKICGKANVQMVTRKTSPICNGVKRDKSPKRSSQRHRPTIDRDRLNKANKELSIRTEELIARRQIKRSADIISASDNSNNHIFPRNK